MPETRPPSPFLLLVFGAAVTSLVSEWMRFQFGAALLVPVAAFGTALTFRATVGAYRVRRAWRMRHAAPEPETAHAGVPSRPSETPVRTPRFTVRTRASESAPMQPSTLAHPEDARLRAPSPQSPSQEESAEARAADILADPGRRR